MYLAHCSPLPGTLLTERRNKDSCCSKGALLRLYRAINTYQCLSHSITHHTIDIARPPQPQCFLCASLTRCTALRCFCDCAFMNVRENVKVWSLCTKFIGHVVLVGVQRVSGLLLHNFINQVHSAHNEIRSDSPTRFRTARANRTPF